VRFAGVIESEEWKVKSEKQECQLLEMTGNQKALNLTYMQ